MRRANIAELRHNLSQILKELDNGKTVEICKRNIPVARLVPYAAPVANRTKLGCGEGTAVVKGDLTEPGIPLDHWDMLQGP